MTRNDDRTNSNVNFLVVGLIVGFAFWFFLFSFPQVDEVEKHTPDCAVCVKGSCDYTPCKASPVPSTMPVPETEIDYYCAWENSTGCETGEDECVELWHCKGSNITP